ALNTSFVLLPMHRDVLPLSALDIEVEGIRLDALVSVLCELGRVEHLAELGTNGPLLASAGAHTTLIELARLQGVVVNPRGEEEPGRMLHEFRHPDDPHAVRLALAGWDFPYYGAVDTTPQWINLLGAYCARHGTAILDEPITDRMWRSLSVRDALVAALAWIVGRLDDPSGGGYLWVRRAS